MRVAVLVAAAIVFNLGCAAIAQDEQPPTRLYMNKEYRFGVIFPAAPMTKEIMYTTRTGTAVPAREFFHETDKGRYAVTIVTFPQLRRTVDAGIVEHAAENIRKRGDILYQARATYDWGIPGRQLNIKEPNGRQLRASVYMYDRHLVITEASAEMGNFEALQFEQSITLFDRNGVEVD